MSVVKDYFLFTRGLILGLPVNELFLLLAIVNTSFVSDGAIIPQFQMLSRTSKRINTTINGEGCGYRNTKF